jgi:hypothetical protein
MRNRILTAIVCSCLLDVTAHGQRPIAHPELLAGPWAFTDASGVDGIFLHLGTHAEGTAAEPVVTSQSISIGVYHCQNGHDTWVGTRRRGRTRQTPHLLFAAVESDEGPQREMPSLVSASGAPAF